MRTCVIELRTNSEILSEILIMTRKSNSDPSAKSLQDENEALKKEIESLKSEFKVARLDFFNGVPLKFEP